MGGSADDIWGVQPMTQPTGLIFAMKSRYTNQAGDEALFNEADTDFGGDGAHLGDNPVNGSYTTGTGLTTADAERLGQGATGDGAFGEMAFSIERTSVTAKTRALKAEYSVELAQDLKAVHGLDAEGELSTILSTEIMLEINREFALDIWGVQPMIFGGFSR
nr:major capsid protein [Myoviridae environmental samples]